MSKTWNRWGFGLILGLFFGANPGLGARPESKPLFVAKALTQMGYYSLPLESDFSAPIILGTVNRNPVYLMVDTGFTFTTVDRSLAGHLEPLTGVNGGFHRSRFGALPGTNWSLIRRFTLNRAEYFNIPTQIRDLRQGHEKQIAFEQGVLGEDFLARNGAIILCGENQILFKARRIAPGDLFQFDERLRRVGFTGVELEALPMDVWVVPVQIGGTNLKLLVDTGAVATLLDEHVSRNLGLQKRWGFSVKLTGVESRETKAQRMTAKDFRVGSYLAAETPLLTGNIEAWNATNEGMGLSGQGVGRLPFNGMLGFDFLQKHSAVIDCERGKLWLRTTGR